MRVQPLAAKQRVAVGPDGICPIDDQFQRKGKPYALGREVHLRFSLDVVESLAFDEILHERHVEQQQDEENDRHEDRDDFQRIFQNLSNHDRRLAGRHRTAEGLANFQAKVTLFHRFLQSVLHGVRKRLPPYAPRLKKLRTNSNRKSSLSVKKSLLLQKIERFMPIKSEVAQLLLHCPDKPGILAEVTDFITVNKGNIVYLDQYVDHAENVFFMRIAWELDGFLIPKEKIEDYFQTLYGHKYQMIFRLYFSNAKPRMAVFVSRMSHCLYDMLARYTAGEWNVEIPLIVSNHPDLEHVARRFDIPFYLFPITKQNKERQEAEEMRLLAENRINFIVLARYMQIVSEKMIEAYPNRIINIHHSFLPAFVGARPYHAAYERGVKIIGATSHYVTTELDAGPIIEQEIVRITHKDTIEDLVNKGKDLEKIVLSRAVQKHIERKVLVYKNKTVIFN